MPQGSPRASAFELAALASYQTGCAGSSSSGAAQESNLPSLGLPALTGFEASACWSCRPAGFTAGRLGGAGCRARRASTTVSPVARVYRDRAGRLRDGVEGISVLRGRRRRSARRAQAGARFFPGEKGRGGLRDRDPQRHARDCRRVPPQVDLGSSPRRRWRAVRRSGGRARQRDDDTRRAEEELDERAGRERRLDEDEPAGVVSRAETVSIARSRASGVEFAPRASRHRGLLARPL